MHDVSHQALPNNIGYEQAFLSGLCQDPDSLDRYTTISPECFHLPANRLIFAAVLELRSKGRPVEFLTVKQALNGLNQLDEVGGPHALDALFSFVSTPAITDWYAGEVLTLWRMRTAVRSMRDLDSRLCDPALSPDVDVRSEIESTLSAIGLNFGEPEKTIQQLVAQWNDELESRSRRIAESGVKFGIADLDQAIGSIQPGEICVIGAHTSIGKSALCLSAIDYSTISKGLTCRLFSAEMSNSQILDRLAARQTRISMGSFRNGLFLKTELAALGQFSLQLARSKLLIHERRPIGIVEIASMLRRDKLKRDLKFAVVDYIQLIQAAAKKGSNREQEIADLSSRLKQLALELDVPIIIASQLNRQGEVRESDRIIHDADIALRLAPDTDGCDDHVIATIEKSRNGERGKRIPLTFIGRYQLFEPREQTNDRYDD